MSIGKQIDKLLEKHNITRLKLSKDTGIPYTTLTQIINGRTKNPQINALERIADYFQESINYLLGKSIFAVIEERLSELNMTIEDLAEQTLIPASLLRGIDTMPPAVWDYEQGQLIDLLSTALKLDYKTLATAFARQEPPVYEGPSVSVEEAFGQLQEDFKDEDFEKENIETDTIETIAAHHEGEIWTEEELQDIEEFKEMLKLRRQLRKNKE